MKKIKKDKPLESMALICKSQEAKTVREFLSKVGDKWSILLIVTISHTPSRRARFSELQRMVEGISQRMLTTTLRNLERDGLVSRQVYPEIPPRVEYQLTDLGLSLLVPMKNLVEWIGTNWSVIKDAREDFDSSKKASGK